MIQMDNNKKSEDLHFLQVIN